MSFLDRLFGSEDSEEPFVVSEPYMWPPDVEKYEFDSDDDERVVYDFDWYTDRCEVDDRIVTSAYRKKAGPYTKIVIIDIPDETDGFGDKARLLQAFYDGSTQLNAQIREYEYETNTDEPNTITIDVECYANTPEMGLVALNDASLSIYEMETLGEIYRSSEYTND